MSSAPKRLSDDGLSTLVTVNGVEISSEAINVESGNFDGGTITERQHQAAVALVVRELLRQRADDLDIEAEDEEARLDRAVETDVTVPQSDEQACREYFNKNQDRFRTEPLVEARHILLAAAPDDYDERAHQREAAEALISKLQKDVGAFARLARQHSACPSREQGGNLGQLSRGQTVPEFDGKVLSLPAGLSARPVETRYGWHVVDIVNRVDGEALPFEAVRERIADYLTEKSRHRAFSQYVRLLVAKADIKGIEMDAAESPLVQ